MPVPFQVDYRYLTHESWILTLQDGTTEERNIVLWTPDFSGLSHEQFIFYKDGTPFIRDVVLWSPEVVDFRHESFVFEKIDGSSQTRDIVLWG